LSAPNKPLQFFKGKKRKKKKKEKEGKKGKGGGNVHTPSDNFIALKERKRHRWHL